MARCQNCNSLFFKTLETRHLPNPKHATLLHKKRCKRCKFKYFIRQDLPQNVTSVVGVELWQQATRVELCEQRMRMTVSEYTRRISKSPEKTTDYLMRVENAEKSGNSCKRRARHG